MLAFRAVLCVSAALLPQLAPAQTSADALDEIVVTAQKRTQNLTDVPISLSVVDSDMLERNRARELGDLSRLTANFSIQRQGGLDTVFIRGIGGGGRNIGFSGRAGVYVDGVYVGQFASLNQDTLDIARVEVLRGPQGQLFGRNTVSGAISIVTEQPGPELAGSVEGGYGNKDLFEIRGMANVPLAEGAAFRISASHRERDGFTINLPTGDDLDNINRDTVRGQFRAELGGGLTLDLAGDYSQNKTDKLLGEPITDTFGTGPSPAPGDFDTPFNRVPFQDIEVAGGSATITWPASDSVELTAISAYRWTDWARSNDLDYIPFDFFVFNFHDEFSQFSQEVRASFGKGAALSGVAGLYYADETAETLRAASAGTDVVFLPLGLVEGDRAEVAAKIRSRSIAAFASIDWAASAALTFNLGGRFTHERRKLVDYATLGHPAINVATIPDFDDARTSDTFDPTIGVTYRLTSAANLYAKYARGHKSGGWNVDFISQASFTSAIRFGDEKVDAFEAGVKGESADRRIRYALAGFHATYDDYQIDQFVDLGGGQTSIQLRNAAKVTSWGGEASIQAIPLTGLTLGVELGYAKASFDSFPDGGGPGVDLDGNRAPYAPRFSSVVNAAYEMPFAPTGGTLGVSANWNYRSSSYSGPENRADQKIDARHLVDAQVELAGAGRRWALTAWVRNLFDADYIENRLFDFFQTRAVERGEPRTYGISARIGI